MEKLSEQKIINFLNNWNGIICEPICSDEIEFYGTYSVGDIVDIGIASRIIKVEYYPLAKPSYGLVTYKMLGKVVIESYDDM